jgi:hypothetical protein
MPSYTRLAFAPLALSGIIMLTGCGSGQDRSTATTKASAAVPIDVTKSKEELDQVVTAARNLRDASDTTDLKKLYGDLKSNRDLWATSLSGVLSSSDSAVTAGKDQITRWHAQADAFTDPGLRNASNKRESDLRDAVDALSTSRMSLVTASDVFNAQLNQVILALDLDLSQTGAKTIKPALGKLVNEEEDERSALSDISAKSSALNAQTSP